MVGVSSVSYLLRRNRLEYPAFFRASALGRADTAPQPFSVSGAPFERAPIPFRASLPGHPRRALARILTTDFPHSILSRSCCTGLRWQFLPGSDPMAPPKGRLFLNKARLDPRRWAWRYCLPMRFQHPDRFVPALSRSLGEVRRGAS